MAVVRPGGTVVLVGLASDEVIYTTMELVIKNVATKVSTNASI
jgi:propanol-preferring alcohol dehydrogenase